MVSVLGAIAPFADLQKLFLSEIMIEEHVYLGHDNTTDLILKADDVAQDLSAVTKITASFDGTLIESEDNESGLIMWNKTGYDTGEIRLNIGDQALTVGSYVVPIVVYDPTNAIGIVWDKILFTVHAEVEAS